jgi:hypothetical protein
VKDVAVNAGSTGIKIYSGATGALLRASTADVKKRVARCNYVKTMVCYATNTSTFRLVVVLFLRSKLTSINGIMLLLDILMGWNSEKGLF